MQIGVIQFGKKCTFWLLYSFTTINFSLIFLFGSIGLEGDEIPRLWVLCGRSGFDLSFTFWSRWHTSFHQSSTETTTENLFF